MELRGRVAVITGASSGFGKGTAMAFAECGVSLALAARRGELLDDLARSCESQGIRALPVPTDVSQRAEVERLFHTALRTLGQIDIWVNNAGVGAIGRFENVPLDEHVQVIETSLLGTLYGSYFAYSHFVAQGHGTLINISSELGKHTVPYYASYTAAKHGVVGLGESLQQEIDQNGIENVYVCTVLPTAHDTPFFDHAANYTGHEVQAPRPLHDPEGVIAQIVRLAQRPEKEKIVGGDGVVKLWMQRFAPSMAQRLGARAMHRTQIERAPRAPDSPGAVKRPTPIGTGIRAGRRARPSASP